MLLVRDVKSRHIYITIPRSNVQMALLEMAIAAFMGVASLAIVILNLKLRDVRDVTLIAHALERRVETELSAMSKEIRDLKDRLVEVSNEVRMLKLRVPEVKEERGVRRELTVEDIERIVELAIAKAIGRREVMIYPRKEPAGRPAVKHTAIPKLSSTEARVLEMLETPKTYKDIVEALGVTREHAARILKRLHELGYVTRDTSKRPYTYVRVTTQRVST